MTSKLSIAADVTDGDIDMTKLEPIHPGEILKRDFMDPLSLPAESLFELRLRASGGCTAASAGNADCRYELAARKASAGKQAEPIQMAGRCWSKVCANALLAVKCCFENNPRPKNHRLEGLQRSSRLTRSNGTPRLLDQEKFSAGLDRTDGPRDGRSELGNAAQAVVFRAGPLRRKRMDGPRGAI